MEHNTYVIESLSDTQVQVTIHTVGQEPNSATWDFENPMAARLFAQIVSFPLDEYAAGLFKASVTAKSIGDNAYQQTLVQL